MGIKGPLCTFTQFCELIRCLCTMSESQSWNLFLTSLAKVFDLWQLVSLMQAHYMMWCDTEKKASSYPLSSQTANMITLEKQCDIYGMGSDIYIYSYILKFSLKYTAHYILQCMCDVLQAVLSLLLTFIHTGRPLPTTHVFIPES